MPQQGCHLRDGQDSGKRRKGRSIHCPKKGGGPEVGGAPFMPNSQGQAQGWRKGMCQQTLLSLLHLPQAQAGPNRGRV